MLKRFRSNQESDQLKSADLFPLAADQERALHIRGRVFRSLDPYKYPFGRMFNWAGLFFPALGYRLSQPQYDALSFAARFVGDDGFYLSAVEGRSAHELPVQWCDLNTSYHVYEESTGREGLHMAAYSPSGKWGLLISDEYHAVIGGTVGFGTSVAARYARFSEDLVEIQERWESLNPENPWLEMLLDEMSNQTGIRPN